MNVLSVILIVVAAIVGAAITYIVIKVKSPSIADQLRSSSQNQDAEIMERLADYEKLKEQKTKIEKLLKEATDKAESLDAQLKQAVKDGKVDSKVVTQLADTEKLKKKIKDLEDQIEEFEDDLEEKEKKLKKRNAEFSELEREKELLVKDHQQKAQELERMKAELQQTMNELSLKMESLNFVQSILSAQEYSDSNTSARYRAIESLSDFIEGRLQDKFKELYNFNDYLKAFFNDSRKRWEAVAKKNWISGKISIAFVGEFSAGKTSIVNRILSQDDPNVPLLPVSTKATTAVPTYITGGVKTIYQFYTPDNKLKSISESDFRRVTKEVLDQVNGVSSLIKYFVMSYKNDNLNNLSILDTPGFSSSDKEDSERTIEVINECDALFWVFDVNAGTVNKTSINLIKNNLKKPVYVVINKVDTKSKSEVDKVEKLIRDTFAREGVPVVAFIRFSSKAPLADIMRPIQQVKITSADSEYLSEMSECIDSAYSQFTEDAKNAKNKFDAKVKAANACVEKYTEQIAATHADCERALSIPKWTEHFFSSDRFEMTPSQYDELCNVLNTICTTRMDNLCNLYDEQMGIQTEAQSCWEEYNRQQMIVAELDELRTDFNKLVNKIK